jgi:hypothetical protein
MHPPVGRPLPQPFCEQISNRGQVVINDCLFHFALHFHHFAAGVAPGHRSDGLPYYFHWR